MCEYCENSKRLYYNPKAGQNQQKCLGRLTLNAECKEVCVELDGSLAIAFVERVYSKFLGKYELNDLSDINIKINYCPMCGKKFNGRR